MVNNLYSDVLCCYIKMLVFIWFFQLDLKLGNALSMFFIALFIISHSPFPIVWYGVVQDGVTPVISDKRLNSLLSNSLQNTFWKSKFQKIFIKQ